MRITICLNTGCLDQHFNTLQRQVGLLVTQPCGSSQTTHRPIGCTSGLLLSMSFMNLALPARTDYGRKRTVACRIRLMLGLERPSQRLSVKCSASRDELRVILVARVSSDGRYRHNWRVVCNCYPPSPSQTQRNAIGRLLGCLWDGSRMSSEWANART